jgi:thiol-disulfide isomerase/thioredoxin
MRSKKIVPALLFCPLIAFALGVGDPAPALKTGKWLQGEPVKQIENDKVYVVEFWATWCGPCVATIPHLNELQKKFADKGLVVIGQNVWEDDDKAVPKFIKKMGDKMSYRVALDDKQDSEEGEMANRWMKAAKQDGIPTAFVVGKDGKIAWIGHPMSGLDEVVEQVLAGTFDPKKAAEIQARIEQEAEKAALIYEGIGSALDEGNWEGAMKKVDELEKTLPAEERAGLIQLRVQILSQSDEPDRINEFVRKAAGRRGH